MVRDHRHDAVALGGGTAGGVTGIARPTGHTAGISPTQAEKLGIDLLSAGYDLAATARAAADAGGRGRAEPHADRSRGPRAGAAATGRRAEEWMSESAPAGRAETPPSLLADVVRAFPGYGEAVEAPLREPAGRAGGAACAAGPHAPDPRIPEEDVT